MKLHATRQLQRNFWTPRVVRCLYFVRFTVAMASKKKAFRPRARAPIWRLWLVLLRQNEPAQGNGRGSGRRQKQLLSLPTDYRTIRLRKSFVLRNQRTVHCWSKRLFSVGATICWLLQSSNFKSVVKRITSILHAMTRFLVRFLFRDSCQKKRYEIDIRTRECRVVPLIRPGPLSGFHAHDVPAGATYRGYRYVGTDAIEGVRRDRMELREP